MCIIIDTNTLANVFDQQSANHKNFKPILDWIIDGKGKVVFGGSKYKSELGKYLSFFVVLKKVNKAVKIDDAIVDNRTEMISKIIKDPDFDDQHLVSLLLVSGCKLICSLDKRAYPFFTHSAFYKRSKNRPKIYCSFRNKKLLVDKNIVDACLPTPIMRNSQKNSLKINLKLK